MTQERAVLAGGCFFGMQDLLRSLEGVLSTRIGYTAGSLQAPRDSEGGSQTEAVELYFDPEKIAYRRILELFFQIHDPTSRKESSDAGRGSARSMIFYTSDQQRHAAEEAIADLREAALWPGTIITEVEAAGDFWEITPEHQDYLLHHPDGYTCHVVRGDWMLPLREAAARTVGHED